MIINLEIEPEFEVACDLLYLKPEEVLRAFIENVSLAKFYSSDEYLSQRKTYPANLPSLNSWNPDGEWEKPKSLTQMATGFIFGYNVLHNERLLPAQKVQKKYAKDIDRLLSQLADEPNLASRYYQLAGFFFDWREAVLLNISEDDAIIKPKSRKNKLNP